MKGIVYTLFNQLVEEKFGIEVWDEILDEVQPESEGIYTTTETYDNTELFALVGALSEKTNIPVNDLVKAFGQFSLGEFARRYPVFFENVNAKEFLQSIHDVIHVEVKKLYTDAELPTFTYEDPAPDKLILHYNSPRKLCVFAEGLIDGTAEYFETGIEYTQTK